MSLLTGMRLLVFWRRRIFFFYFRFTPTEPTHLTPTAVSSSLWKLIFAGLAVPSFQPFFRTRRTPTFGAACTPDGNPEYSQETRLPA